MCLDTYWRGIYALSVYSFYISFQALTWYVMPRCGFWVWIFAKYLVATTLYPFSSLTFLVSEDFLFRNCYFSAFLGETVLCFVAFCDFCFVFLVGVGVLSALLLCGSLFSFGNGSTWGFSLVFFVFSGCCGSVLWLLLCSSAVSGCSFWRLCVGSFWLVVRVPGCCWLLVLLVALVVGGSSSGGVPGWLFFGSAFLLCWCCFVCCGVSVFVVLVLVFFWFCYFFVCCLWFSLFAFVFCVLLFSSGGLLFQLRCSLVLVFILVVVCCVFQSWFFWFSVFRVVLFFGWSVVPLSCFASVLRFWWWWDLVFLVVFWCFFFVCLLVVVVLVALVVHHDQVLCRCFFWRCQLSWQEKPPGWCSWWLWLCGCSWCLVHVCHLCFCYSCSAFSFVDVAVLLEALQSCQF